MVNDRAGHARHEGPVLPSWDVNEEPKYRTQLRAGFLTTSKDHELFDRGDYDLPLEKYACFLVQRLEFLGRWHRCLKSCEGWRGVCVRVL